MGAEAAKTTDRARRCPLCHGALERGPTTSCPDCATDYHAACVRELDVPCSTLGCARATSKVAARPSPKTPAEPAPAQTGHGPTIPLVLAWVMFAGFPLFALPFWGWALWRGARHGVRSRSFKASVLLCPLVAAPLFFGALALAGYLTGTAKLMSGGLPGPGFRNLDRTLRCSRSSSGCVMNGQELFVDLPNNLVLWGLGALFGRMPGAYAGPYPTEEEALAAVEPSRDQPFSDLVELDGQKIPLELGSTAKGLLQLGSVETARGYLECRVRQALVGGRCLVIDGPAVTVLVDATSGKDFALYPKRYR